MGRILAVDYGQKRTGIAVTDPLQLIANGLVTVPTSEIFSFLAEYFGKEAVEAVVVGYPREMNNLPSEAVQYIEPFVRKLKKMYPEKNIVMMDERFTSKIAVRAMIEGGAKKKTRQNKSIIDRISATIILQSYLEMRKSRDQYLTIDE
ncbi:MAG: Holliday junction resolvase RuvX [Bacteroidales bacterium]|nr:Holliday junction resolvase RuvX [Bacteroidales bacterium]